MAIKKGICKNFGECELADKKIIQEADSTNFVCSEPGCGMELYEVEDSGGSSKNKYMKHIAIGAGVLALAGVGTYFMFGKEMDVEAVSLSKSNSNIALGEKDTLRAILKPEGATAILRWTSSDTTVLTVQDGIVTAVAPGEAKIGVQIQGKKLLKAFCDYSVNEKVIFIKEILLKDGNEMTLKENDDRKISYLLSPSDASEKLIWTSDNPDVATVTDGVVQGVRAGNTVITLESESHAAVCKIKVTVMKDSPKSPNMVLGGRAVYSPQTAIIDIRKTVTMDLHTRDGETITLHAGDKIIGAKVQDGYLLQGEFVINGESRLFTGLHNYLY
ncbi:MAG TPA: Ig-like domain-containing protein [Candidatus Paraprevotella stercorigallinarum]|nr:Ig-like domain-containing protein [Candidatus Paraprevotella stercorigallinarum]